MEQYTLLCTVELGTRSEKAAEKVCKRLVEHLGLEPARLHIQNVSAHHMHGELVIDVHAPSDLDALINTLDALSPLGAPRMTIRRAPFRAGGEHGPKAYRVSGVVDVRWELTRHDQTNHARPTQAQAVTLAAQPDEVVTHRASGEDCTGGTICYPGENPIPFDLQHWLGVFGYSASWMSSEFIDARFVFQQATVFAKGPDLDVSHYKWGAYRHVLKSEDWTNRGRFRQFVDVMEKEVDEYLQRGAISELIEIVGVPVAWFLEFEDARFLRHPPTRKKLGLD
ncbi:MAG: hypothetical protein ACI81R_003035 [Bradymonadia bacterium]